MSCRIKSIVVISNQDFNDMQAQRCMFQLVDLDVWVQLVQVFATLGLVYYAYVTINEAKKNRRKDTIERMLENVHSPMREILERARSEKIGQREAIRKQPAVNGTRDYVFTPQEFDEVRRIIERYGYYLGSPELERLKFDLEKVELAIPSYKPEEGPVPGFRFDNNVFDNHWRFFDTKVKQLTAELDHLTGIS